MQTPFRTTEKLTRVLFSFIVFSLLAFLPQTNLQANAHHSGATLGSFSVDGGGNASYSVKLQVPPGTSGMAPQLSLNYSSQSGNGLLGVGWSVSGATAIHRCAQTKAQDGQIKGVNFSATDRFCLDGQRLIAVNGAYGASGTEYRTELANYSKIVSYGVAGAGPEKFKVWTKSGQIIEYGFTVDSRIEAQGRADVMLWSVNRILDTVGNYMDYVYFEDNANGHYRLDKINYTGNVNTGLVPNASVRFVYADRTDKSIGYVAGSKTTQPVRTSNIQTFSNSTLVRDYQLSYEYGVATNHSRLIRLLECNGTECKLASTFTYTKNGDGNFKHWTNSSTFRGKTDVYTHYFADVNGDGLPDWIMVANSTNNGWIGLNQNNGLFQHWTNGSTARGAAYAYPHHFADMNGDGRIDWIMTLLNDNNGYIGLANKDGVIQHWSNNSVARGAVKNNTHYFADVNGDGRTDWIQVQKANNNGWVGLADKTGNISHWTNYAVRGATNNYDHYFIDTNGDGLPDWIQIDKNTNQAWVGFSTGDGNFQHWSKTFTVGNAKDHNHYFADINGDGLKDLIQVSKTENIGKVALSKGDGTFELWTNTSTARGATNSNTHYFADVNGDGRADWIQVQKYANNGWVGLGQLDGNFQHWTNHSTARGAAINYPHHFVDVNGDGRADWIMTLKRDNNGYVGLANGTSKSDLLVSITDGLGDKITVNYKPITDKTIYTKHNNATYPIVDIQAPMYVVSSFGRIDGVGGSYTFSYKYEGAKVDSTGRGFLGFNKVTVKDDRSGSSTSTTYSQVWPSNGMPLSVETRLSNGTLIEKTINLYEVRNLALSRKEVHLKSTDKTTYELNGTKVVNVTTSNTYDSYGNALSVNVDYHDGFSKTTNSQYTNDIANWYLGRLTQASVTSITPNQGSKTRVSSFSYDVSTGLLKTETIEPNDATLSLTTTYTYDPYGNKTVKTVSGPSIVTRSISTTYDARGQFPLSISNALGHTQSATYDARYGAKLTQTGPNGLTTRWVYDSLGRVSKEIRADGTETVKTYSVCTVNCENGYPLTITTHSTGSMPVTVSFDPLGREVMTQSYGFDGRKVFKFTTHDSNGRVKSVSSPYYEGEPYFTTTYTYDVLGRMIKETKPDNSYTTVAYGVLTTTHTNHQGQKVTKAKNSQGQLIRSTDNQGNSNLYEYDPFGSLVKVTDAAGNVTSMSYNIRGHKISMTDPNMGAWTYSYNTLGQLLFQKDAKNQSMTMQYDVLGRLIKRTEAEGISTWQYDTAAKGIGKIASVTGHGGYQSTSSYDSLGRPSSSTTVINGTSYSQSISYDSFSRPVTTTYPSGFVLTNVYNAQGFLSEVKNVASTKVYWKAVTINAKGQVTQEKLGNGLTTTRGYDDATGRINGITTGNGTVQLLTYQFSTIGNLIERKNHITNKTETSTYDDLNRLSSTTVTGGATKSYQYDVVGNITFKTGVGTYLYAKTGGAGPNAVTKAGNATYTYDANGNMASGDGRTLTYTSFNKPLTITKGGTSNSYTYTPGRGRLTKISNTSSGTTTTTYLSKSFEVVSKSNSSVTEQRHYISAGGTTVIYTKRSNGTTDTKYLHKDHLGSVDVITNEAGTALERQSFDPWGLRRNVDWTDLSPGTTLSSLTTRGFTGHEMDDGVGLVNMNARMYDAKLGRFLQPDTYIQFPDSTQGFNRYTYVNNNPLSYTDPTGHFLKKLFRKVKRFVKKYGRTIVAIAAAVYLPHLFTRNLYFGLPIKYQTAAVLGRSAASFVSGLVAGGGDIETAFRGVLISAISGAINTQLSTLKVSSLSAFVKQVGVSALGGCASARIMNGSCSAGAKRAAYARALKIGMDKISGYESSYKLSDGEARVKPGPELTKQWIKEGRDPDVIAQQADNVGTIVWSENKQIVGKTYSAAVAYLKSNGLSSGNLHTSFGSEIGYLRNVARYFPGANAAGVWHDRLAGKIERFLGLKNSTIKGILSAATIPHAFALHYAGLGVNSHRYYYRRR